MEKLEKLVLKNPVHGPNGQAWTNSQRNESQRAGWLSRRISSRVLRIIFCVCIVIFCFSISFLFENYFEMSSGNGESTLTTLKILIIGESGVGKSRFARYTYARGDL